MKLPSPPSFDESDTPIPFPTQQSLFSPHAVHAFIAIIGLIAASNAQHHHLANRRSASYTCSIY